MVCLTGRGSTAGGITSRDASATTGSDCRTRADCRPPTSRGSCAVTQVLSGCIFFAGFRVGLSQPGLRASAHLDSVRQCRARCDDLGLRRKAPLPWHIEIPAAPNGVGQDSPPLSEGRDKISSALERRLVKEESKPLVSTDGSSDQGKGTYTFQDRSANDYSKDRSEMKAMTRPPGAKAWTMGIITMMVVPIFIFSVLGVTNQHWYKNQKDKKTLKREKTFNPTSLLANVQEKCHHSTLRFFDKQDEQDFIEDNASRVCDNAQLAVWTMMMYAVKNIVFTYDEHAVNTFRPILRKWNTSARVVYNFAWLHILFLSGSTFALLHFLKYDQRRKKVEKVVVCWAFLVVTLLMTFANRYTIAAITGDSVRRSFTHFEGDAEMINELIAILVFLSMYTPVRFCIMIYLAFFMVITYPITCYFWGSPDGFTWRLNFQHSHSLVAGRLGYLELAQASWLGVLVALVVTGQRRIEIKRRSDFLALAESAKLIADLQEDPASNGSGPLDKGRNALKKSTEMLQALQKHAAVVTASPVKYQLVQIEKQVTVASKCLANADRLFDVKTEDVLNDSRFADYKDVKGIQGFIAMTGQAAAPKAHSGGLAPPGGPNGQVQLLKGTMRDAGISKHTVHSSGQDASVLKKKMNSAEMKVLRELQGVGNDFDFNALHLARETGNRALLHVAEVVFVRPPFRQALPKSDDEISRSYIREIHRRYPENEYHNEAHAATVAHMALYFATETGFMDAMANDIERMALMIGALCHDTGHFGRTNLFLQNTLHTCGLIWNDSSILENMHAASCFMVSEKDKCRIFDGMTLPDRGQMRKLIVQFILGTDLKNHSESVMKFTARKEAPDFLKHPDDDGDADGRHVARWVEDKAMLGRMCLQASDVGHGGSCWELHKEWSFRILCEFFEQGDEEKRMGLPVSPLCERNGYNIIGNQCFFIDFISKSTLVLLNDVAEKDGRDNISTQVVKQCDDNKDLWKSLYSNNEFDGNTHSMKSVPYGGQSLKGPLLPYTMDPENPLPPCRLVTTEELLREVSTYRPQCRSLKETNGDAR